MPETKKGAPVCSEAIPGDNPLFVACQNGHVDIVEKLIRSGEDLFSKNNSV